MESRMSQPTLRASTDTLIRAAMHSAEGGNPANDGVRTALLEAAQRMRELQELLVQCLPHVEASSEAAHILDGFKRKHHPLDRFAEELRAVVKGG